jgi:hypothetical protein
MKVVNWGTYLQKGFQSREDGMIVLTAVTKAALLPMSLAVPYLGSLRPQNPTKKMHPAVYSEPEQIENLKVPLQTAASTRGPITTG